MIPFLHFFQSHFVEAVSSPSLKKWPSPEVHLLDLPYVVIDTETTGYHPQKGDRIISIGAVKWDPREKREVDSFYQLVNPLRSIPEMIQSLTGITGEMVEKRPPIEEVLPSFLEWIGVAVVIGHAIRFDLRFMEAALRREYRGKFPFPFADTKQLAHLLYPSLSPHSLESLANHFSLPVVNRHHSLEDARLTGKVFGVLLDHLTERGLHTWSDLLQYLKVREHPLMKGKGESH